MHWSNTASGVYSAVPGGQSNTASGAHSLAAGFGSTASHDHAFVWSDTNARSSVAADSVTFGCSGGARFLTSTNGTIYANLAAGSGTWSAVGDRNAKEGLVELDYPEVLKSILRLPLYSYNYKGQPADQLYRGPMAQDWHALFPSGKDPLQIDTMDLDGLALAAIRGLGAENAALRTEIAALRTDNAALRTEIEMLRAEIEAFRMEIGALRADLLVLSSHR